MIEMYLDSADLEKIACVSSSLNLKGVTTNPSILAKADQGLNEFLQQASVVLSDDARFHVQVTSITLQDIIDEAVQINALPYDIVIKIPATKTGLAAIKQVSAMGIPVLATAVYSAHQGFVAALNGADYLAPYVNRIAMNGVDAIQQVADLQLLLNLHALDCKILAASFKNVHQVVEIMKLGVGAITLPIDIAEQMTDSPQARLAESDFLNEWQNRFDSRLSYQV